MTRTIFHVGGILYVFSGICIVESLVFSTEKLKIIVRYVLQTNTIIVRYVLQTNTIIVRYYMYYKLIQ
jgi:hypothetical protein